MFQPALKEAARQVQGVFDTVLAEYADQPVVDAMRYGVEGGKGLRGFLVLETARLHGIPADAARWAAAAVEAVHAYSLIHDDLPAMDDDDLRRGQPTVHKKWDEATAVLAGDALQTLGFDLLARDELGPAATRIALVSGLAKAAGAEGMVLGQAQDIAAETAGRALTLEEITQLQANKTGALIQWSGTAGAVLAGADPAPLTRYAAALGLAFQIADDILDVEGDVATVGKALRKDGDAGKATFVSLLGLDGAKKRAISLVEDAEDALAPYGDKSDILKAAARFVIERDK